MTAMLAFAAGAGGAAFALTALALWPLVGWLRRRAVMDIPNHRSSHVIPTPRGGGIAVSAVMVVGGLAVFAGSDQGVTLASAALVAGAAGLAVLSWLDDLGDLPRRLRFAGQAVAVIACLAVLPLDVSVTGGWLDAWIERPLLALAWIWFTNLYNFMDGIDGITGVETAQLGLGLAVIAALLGGGVALWPILPLGAVAAGAALGFLLWNWHPAKVFMGDVGSVPLGFLLGGLLIALAAAGAWLPALILPAYYLTDATLTLVSRVLRGHSPVEAHRDHAYQQATAHMTHRGIVGRIALTNAILLAAAVLALAGHGWAGATVALGAVSVLLWRFKWRPVARAVEKAGRQGKAQAG